MKTIIKKKLFEECLNQCREFGDKPNLLTQTCFRRRFSTRFPISLDQLARENSLRHCKIKVGLDPYVNTDVPEYLAIGIRLSRM